MSLIKTKCRHYILQGHSPVAVSNLLEWARQFDIGERHVATDQIGDVYISTVFLGLDHNFSRGGPPILFETSLFGGEFHQYQKRYCTWDEAEAGHREVVEQIKSGQPPHSF